MFTKSGRTYLPFQAQSDLYQSVQSQLQAGYLVAQDTDGRPLLSLIVLHFEAFAVLRIRLLKLLLDHGADPNQPYQNSPPWQDVLEQTTADVQNQQSDPYFSLYMEC